MKEGAIRPLKQVITVILFCLLASVSVSAVARIENTVIIDNPQKTTLHVVTTIKDVNQPQIEIGIPNWTPGYYFVEDFARNISRLVFTDQNGRALSHQKRQDSLWLLDVRNVKDIRIEFDYTANTIDLNKSLITPSYAILNGTNFLFYVKGHTQDLPTSVTFKLPSGWRVATGLTPGADPMTFGAADYDELVDCPALVGEFDQVTLLLRGVPHHLVVAPKGIIPETILRQHAADIVKIVDVHTQMFGEIPYKQYWTINVFDKGFGGIEHSNSYLGLFTRLTAEPENIKSALSIHSHEFFHAFNVKRIRPAEMVPYHYNERNFTSLLWVSEGITNYYGERGLLRAGFLTTKQYLQRHAQVMSMVQANESAKYVSIEEASVSTWQPDMFEGERRYAPDYYTCGQVIGLMLDLSIRHDTNNSSSLDDVMRALYRDFYKKGRGFTTADLIAIINRLTKRDYETFFRNYVGGTEPLPYDEVLAYAGLRLVETKQNVASAGFQMQRVSHLITAVTSNSAAEAAGVQKGDTVLGIGNLQTGKANWETEFRKAYANKIGEDATLYLLRDGKPLTVSLKIGSATISTWDLEPLNSRSVSQENILEAWSSGK